MPGWPRPTAGVAWPGRREPFSRAAGQLRLRDRHLLRGPARVSTMSPGHRGNSVRTILAAGDPSQPTGRRAGGPTTLTGRRLRRCPAFNGCPVTAASPGHPAVSTASALVLADGGEQQQIQRPDVVTAAPQRDPEHWIGLPGGAAASGPPGDPRPVPPKSAFWVMSAILASARKTAMTEGSAPVDPREDRVRRTLRRAAVVSPTHRGANLMLGTARCVRGPLLPLGADCRPRSRCGRTFAPAP
jgi:hypothetical protein